MTKHSETCSVPICADDTNPNFKSEVVWRPGEPICNKKPLQPFQKKQKDINNLVKKGTWKFRDEDDWFTVDDLEGRTTRRV